MFSSLGLFRDISCPRLKDCALQNCLFNHSHSTEGGPFQDKAASERNYDPTSAEHIDLPAAKRRRLEPEVSNKDEESRKLSAVAPIRPPPHTAKPVVAHDLETQHISRTNSLANVAQKSIQTIPRQLHQPKPVTIFRPISPPPKSKPQPVSSIPKHAVQEKLLPRQVVKSPVPFKSRLSYVELLFKLVKNHNSKVASSKNVDKTIILTDQELIKLILNDEEKAALATSTDLYKNTMSQHYLQYKNMSLESWQTFVAEKSQAKTTTSDPASSVTISTGLTGSEEIELLRGLKTSVVGLELHGYVSAPPTKTDIDKAKRAIDAASGFEVCDRCGTRFQVFPGRDNTGRLTSQGGCYYHWAKASRPQTARGPKIGGQTESFHPCCNKPPGSEGCTMADTHVYKVSDPKRLATILQFERTPPHSQVPRRVPVAFDCEMAYTTLGMELIRVTAISWPDNKTLLDVLVRPYGEILDFNTRFSGVSKEQFANAPAYQGKSSSANDNTMQAAEPRLSILHKVESLSCARQLMFDLLTPDTPLIGHAIENDLNVCRMIHPFIIDTVLLYPHPAGLPARYGLKFLASKFLHRGIQTGGAQGHDSKEDSIATGDLVKAKVAEKWKSMKLQGWEFKDGHLSAPARSKEDSRV